MSRNTVIVTYYLGRRSRGPLDGYTDEVWLVAEIRPAEDARSQDQGDVPLDTASARELAAQLEKAVSDILARDVEGLVWKADNLPAGQLADVITGLPDSVQTLADQRLYGLASAIGMPAPAALLASQVAGTMLLEPVMKPIENTVHGLELAGAVMGLLGGPHALAFVCVKHLIHDYLGDLLSDGFSSLLRPEPAPPQPGRPVTRPGTDNTGLPLTRGPVPPPTPGRRVTRPGTDNTGRPARPAPPDPVPPTPPPAPPPKAADPPPTPPGPATPPRPVRGPRILPA